MKDSTKSFLENLDKGKSIRESINVSLKESRFFFYAQNLKNNTDLASLAKAGKEKELAQKIFDTQKDLKIPVRLTLRGARRLAQLMVVNAKEA